MNFDARKVLAAPERPPADRSDRFRNADARKAFAATERPLSDRNDGVWNANARKALATLERPRSDRSDRVWDADAREFIATRKSAFNICCPFGDDAYTILDFVFTHNISLRLPVHYFIHTNVRKRFEAHKPPFLF